MTKSRKNLFSADENKLLLSMGKKEGELTALFQESQHLQYHEINVSEQLFQKSGDGTWRLSKDNKNIIRAGWRR